MLLSKNVLNPISSSPNFCLLRGPGGGGLHQDFLEIDFLVVSDREE